MAADRTLRGRAAPGVPPACLFEVLGDMWVVVAQSLYLQDDLQADAARRNALISA